MYSRMSVHVFTCVYVHLYTRMLACCRCNSWPMVKTAWRVRIMFSLITFLPPMRTGVACPAIDVSDAIPSQQSGGRQCAGGLNRKHADAPEVAAEVSCMQILLDGGQHSSLRIDPSHCASLERTQSGQGFCHRLEAPSHPLRSWTSGPGRVWNGPQSEAPC